MIGVVTASASTGLSPEWDRWFDEAFTELITGDEEFLRTEFDELIASGWRSTPSPSRSSSGESPPDGSPVDPPEDIGGSGGDPERPSRPPP